jgi:hypothetical protein
MPRGIATARELSLGIGCHALIRIAGGGAQAAAAEVEIIDTRQRWGAVDALVRPVAGRGETWVALSSLRPMPPAIDSALDIQATRVSADLAAEPRLAAILAPPAR